MMTRPMRRFAAALLVGLGLALGSVTAQADPPYRVARLSYASGAVSFSPAGEDEWARASINRPLVTGDRVWVDAGSRAELQLDAGALRIGEQTSVQLLNIGDRIGQLQLTQGEIDLRVWRLAPDQSVEIDTPNLALVIRRPGSFRIDASARYASTAVTVRAGEAMLYGEGNAFVVRPGDTWEFFDTALRDYDRYRPDADDDLARFAASRDRAWESSASARFVSPEVIGFQELDAYGQWQQTPDYGWVWYPTRVATGWAPYREGHWAWVEPWGWTWVDDAPWGFAPSHYGRWAFVRERWCWVPGPVTSRPVYAPALVAFVGAGSGVVGWFPLGPREVYRPAYTVSRDYFTRVNVTNTTVNLAQVTNIYETRNPGNIVYRNQRVPGAVVAVPTATFTQARPVGREAVHLRPDNMRAQPAMPAPGVVPARQSVLGPLAAQRKPPERAFARPVVAQTQPPAAAAPFESRLPDLRSHQGRPVDPSAERARPASPAAPAPLVRVMPAQRPAATPPQPIPSANRPQHQRRGPPEQRDAQAPLRIETPNERGSLPRPATPAAAVTPPPTPALAVPPRDERPQERPAFGRPAPAPAPTPAPAMQAMQPQPRPAAHAPQPMPATPPPTSAPTMAPRDEERLRERPAFGRPADAPAPVAAPPAAQAVQVQPRPAQRSPQAMPAAPQQRPEERRNERRDTPGANGPAPGHRQPEEQREQQRQ